MTGHERPQGSRMLVQQTRHGHARNHKSSLPREQIGSCRCLRTVLVHGDLRGKEFGRTWDNARRLPLPRKTVITAKSAVFWTWNQREGTEVPFETAFFCSIAALVRSADRRPDPVQLSSGFRAKKYRLKASAANAITLIQS